jgi:hypothetical protein
MQQQQMAQQQSQPQGPMPVPAGVPQPQMQPEAPPAMMARGGLTSIPVRSDMFEYARGGIIAFQEGGQTEKYETPYDRMNRKNREAATEKPSLDASSQDPVAKKYERESIEMGEGKRTQFSPDVQMYAKKLRDSERSDQENFAQQERQRMLQGSPMMAQLKSPSAPKAAPFEQASLRKMEGQMAPSGLPGAAQQMGANAAPPAASPTPRPPMPGAARPPAPLPAAAPAVPQAGLPGAAAAMTPQDEVAKLSLDAVRTPAKAMTPEEAMAQEGKFASQYGLDKKFGEEERGLLALMKQRQAQQAAGRPMEELGATLRGFGQGYGGASAAGERASRETYEMDMANQREALNAINAINKENLATGKERYKSGSGLFGKSEEAAAAANRERTQTLGNMRGQDIAADTAKENRLTQVQIAKLQAATANRPSEAERIEANYRGMIAKGQSAEADAYLERISKIKGGAGTAGVGADNAQTRKLRDAVKDIDSRLEFMDPKSPEFKTLQVQRDRLSKLIIERAIGEADAGNAGGAPKVMTQADVLATAKSSGKTPQQVIEAAKARGYAIQ